MVVRMWANGNDCPCAPIRRDCDQEAAELLRADRAIRNGSSPLVQSHAPLVETFDHRNKLNPSLSRAAMAPALFLLKDSI
jgi:hypothetical protein